LKLAISGKGGTGKSTISGLLSHYFSKAGYKVLAIDSDPDSNLASAIGIPQEEIKKIITISEERLLIKERTGANPSEFGQMFKINPTVDDIPDKYSYTYKRIKLLVFGAVRKGGAGCACPENVLLKSLLADIILNKDEIVIVDMEAGIEHLGRGSSKSIDLMLIVVEPGSRSIETANNIFKLAGEIGVSKFGIIANKICNDEQAQWVKSQFPQNIFLGAISTNEIIARSDFLREPLIDIMDDKLKKEFDEIYSRILNNKLDVKGDKNEILR
jgi:CO dehydrogenase maturation factor